MSDIALVEKQDGSFDLDFDEKSKDFVLTNSLYNAVAISIGTYARNRNLKPNSAVLDPQIGGWWADSLDPLGTLGGYLYEAYPGKLSQDTLAKLKDLVVEALQWMIDEGIAKSTDCEVSLLDEKFVMISVSIEKPNGTTDDYKYELNWMATNEI
jgi:phage gp46-like protein